MRALTLWQPWASLVAIGAKTIETRSWPAPASAVGERIAIHAAATTRGFHELPGDCEGTMEAGWRYGYLGNYQAAVCLRSSDEGRRGEAFIHDLSPTGPAEPTPIPLGAVVATARLAACIPMEDLDAPLEEVEGTIDHGRVLYIRPRVDPFDFAIDARRHEHPPIDIDRSDQLPFGEFAQGRWAWLLEDVVSLPAPIPARGGQRIWRWAGAA